MKPLCRKKLHDLSDPASVYVRPNGCHAQCRACLHAAHRKRNHERRLEDPAFRERENNRSTKWAIDNHEHRRAYEKAYWATHPEQDKINRRVNYARHREQILAYGAQWRVANPDRMKQLVREWALANPDRRTATERQRRARKAGVATDKHSRADVLARWGNLCWICNKELPVNWHEDHVIPLCLSGSDLLENCRPACASCNLRKGGKLLSQEVQNFVQDRP